jgi:hypothetical protein
MNTGLIAGAVKPLRGTLDANGCVYAIIRSTGGDGIGYGANKLSLNVKAYDPNNLVSLANSVFTLRAGSYVFIGQTTVWLGQTEGLSGCQLKIRNTSDSLDVANSAVTSAGVTSVGGLAGIDSYDTHTHVLMGQITITSGSKDFELQAYSLPFGPAYLAGQTSNNGNVNQVLIIKVA